MGKSDNPSPILIDGDLIICRCEEITKQQIVDAIYEGYTTVSGIRKRTRAGMGFCQGKTCSELIRQILCQYTDISQEKIIPARARPPVRPLSAGTLAKGGDTI